VKKPRPVGAGPGAVPISMRRSTAAAVPWPCSGSGPPSSVSNFAASVSNTLRSASESRYGPAAAVPRRSASAATARSAKGSATGHSLHRLGRGHQDGAQPGDLAEALFGNLGNGVGHQNDPEVTFVRLDDAGPRAVRQVAAGKHQRVDATLAEYLGERCPVERAPARLE